MWKHVPFSLGGLQPGLLVPAFCKGLLGSVEEIPTTFGAVIMARLVNANKKPLGWTLGEEEKPFSHQVFAGSWLIKAGMGERSLSCRC